jgi:hypothetical protein
VDDHARPAYASLSQTGFYIDLGAERLLAAEKDTQKIAVEVKSFIAASALAALEEVVAWKP